MQTPAVCPKFCSFDMAETWYAKAYECESKGLPFTFWDCTAAKMMEFECLIDFLALKDRDTEEFYVGATRDPIDRWIGFLNPVTGGRKGGWVPDHRQPRGRGGKGMVELHVLAVLLGKEAKAVETTLIQYSQKMYPDLCSNKAPDSRGIQDEGVFYIYVTRRCHVLDMALPSGRAPAEAVRTRPTSSSTPCAPTSMCDFDDRRFRGSS